MNPVNSGRMIRLRWPQLDSALQVVLLDGRNPGLADALWQATPLVSIQSHAVVAGQQIYFPTRLALPDPAAAFSEPMHKQPPGRVNFEPYFQYVALNYGPMSEPAPAWPLGQVVEADLAKLPSLGERIWQRFLAAQTDLLVIVEQLDAPLAIEPAGGRTTHHGVHELPAALSWSELLRFVEAEIEAIWLNEPADVQALRMGLPTGEAGVNGQYFSPWVMVSGLVRSLAIVDLAALARLSHHPGFDLAHLQVLVHEMLTVMLGVVGYFGLPQLAAVLAAVDRTVDQIDERAAFIHFVTTVQTYVNRYNLWLHQTFPWRLGAEFPKPKPADVGSC